MSQPIRKTGFLREYWADITSLEENVRVHNILSKFNDFIFVLYPAANLLLVLRLVFLKITSTITQGICVIWVTIVLATYLVQISNALKTYGFRRINAFNIILMLGPLLIVSKPSNFPVGVFSPFWFLLFFGIGTLSCYGVAILHRRPTKSPLT